MNEAKLDSADMFKKYFSEWAAMVVALMLSAASLVVLGGADPSKRFELIGISLTPERATLGAIVVSFVLLSAVLLKFVDNFRADITATRDNIDALVRSKGLYCFPTEAQAVLHAKESYLVAQSIRNTAIFDKIFNMTDPQRTEAWMNSVFHSVEEFCARNARNETDAAISLVWRDILSPSSRRLEKAKRTKEKTKGLYDYVIMDDHPAINYVILKHRAPRPDEVLFGWVAPIDDISSRKVFLSSDPMIVAFFEQHHNAIWTASRKQDASAV